LLIEIDEDPTREDLLDTPMRVARALEFLTSRYRTDTKQLISGACFTQETSSMVIVKDIEVYSMCDHHMPPFFGRCHIDYIPIMGSNGGAMTLQVASQCVAGTFLSGPVGGVSGAIRVAELAGLTNIITFDMGGTSTDVSLVHALTPRMSYNNQIDAYPLQMPQLDIHAIGAGGGSIVWIGADGTLQIGPQSAGAITGQ
jgi:hypothetical protein